MSHTPQQREAIESIDRNLQIVACAGSGKTRVVSARIIHILKSQAANGITPENIVAFTFTEKAAAELKDRISRLHEAEFGHVEGLAGMYVGTIHGFCLDLLQRYLYRYLKCDILDEVKQQLFIDRYYRQCGMHSLGLRRWLDTRLFTGILGMLRGADADPEVLADHPARAALESYQALLDQHGYLDYDEILLRAVVEIQTNAELRSALSDRVKYLTVDEYQDVNPVQEMLVRQLYELGANLCVVGDDDQNVYQWRGSDVSHILTFTRRYPNVLQRPLEANFRSSAAVVDVARRAVEANTNRLPKQMVSRGSQVFERGDLLALRFDDPEAEAEWIAERILSLRGAPYLENGTARGLSWSDCAILLRSVRNCGGPIVEALRKRGIPYIVTGMSGLFDTPEAQAAAAVFQFMVREIDAETVKLRWQAAELGLNEADLDRGIATLEGRRGFEAGKRFSTYNLQRTYLDFLEAVQLREERVPDGRGEVVYYNLGKFSQVISDYEEIHFKSRPEEKYRSFVDFLRYKAPGYYPEGGQDVAYAQPDAVRLMTVHQSKGMEYPVVFLPCLQKNRFPGRKQFNAIWKHLPRHGIRNADRFDSSVEDERRLFYVALTRSEKYLFCSWAPDAGNQLYRRPSAFWEELTRCPQFLTRETPSCPGPKLEPQPRVPLVNVELSFSELKYFFECPYQFKLRFLYGFNAPLHEALGYGRSLHNALAEVHRRALNGDELSERDIPELLDTHLHVRFAYPELEAQLRSSAEKALGLYLRENGPALKRVVHVEEVVEITLPGGILVHGRIDLIKKVETDEVAVVDFKSVERAQPEDVTRMQLHVYAMGYEQRFGGHPDLIEIHNLDHGGSVRELVDQNLITQTVKAVTTAGDRLRQNQLLPLPSWCGKCSTCDMAGICRSAPSVPTSA
ncbi:MAG: ATP-dependent helicase [Armatimonadota bacterium]